MYSTKNLAIIIPAFKIQFFERTLQSLAGQTNKDFTVYVGDDCSEADFFSVVNKYSPEIGIVYKKFDSNLGGIDLVAQWERCIDLSVGEPWIWLFSDDDIIGSRCVELFYNRVKKGAARDIFHFNVNIIDENDRVIRKIKPYPSTISSEELYVNKETAKIESFVVEYIFSRRIYEKVGGFQKFDLAWGSDLATWIKMGAESGIETICGDCVYWRQSHINITPNISGQIVFRKCEASLDYMKWAELFFNTAATRRYNKRIFGRLLFHYSAYLSKGQIEQIIDEARKRSLITIREAELLSVFIPLIIFLKKIKDVL